jgi:hypothetical protein
VAKASFYAKINAPRFFVPVMLFTRQQAKYMGRNSGKEPLARDGFFAGNDLLAVSSVYLGLELATTGLYWLAGLPLVGAQILVVLLARSSSDRTRLIPPALHMPVSAYDGAHGTSSDDVGRLQRDRRAAAPGDPGTAAGG